MTNEEAKEILNILKKHERAYQYSKEEVVGALDMAIQALEQQPETGHWIDTGSGQMCSKCGEIQYGYDNFRRFCASCGAKMAESEEE